jgi:dTDP-4-amino-4,6-dideoxygalactose transaminase
VIVPSFTFVASAHALQWLGIKPVFCDIDPQTHNLDPQCVEALITPETTGILGVHVWGRPCAIHELTRIANRHGLKLAFDAAHAFGSSFQGSMIGCFGEAEVFSFHATKFYNSFEGGAITTNNDELAQKMRSMTNFGFQGYDNVVSLGINGKMTEPAAAMGLVNLDALDQFVETNLRNYNLYRKELSNIPGVKLVAYDEREKNNYQYIIAEIDGEQSILTRDQINDILHAENVLSRRYFFPGCHLMEPYRTLYPEMTDRLYHTNRLTTRTLSLPNGTAVDEEDIRAICQMIRLAVENGDEVAHRLVFQQQNTLKTR